MSSTASKEWGATLLDYMNGKAADGLILKQGQQAVSGDWWAWGCLTGKTRTDVSVRMATCVRNKPVHCSNALPSRRTAMSQGGCSCEWKASVRCGACIGTMSRPAQGRVA